MSLCKHSTFVCEKTGEIDEKGRKVYMTKGGAKKVKNLCPSCRKMVFTKVTLNVTGGGASMSCIKGQNSIDRILKKEEKLRKEIEALDQETKAAYNKIQRVNETFRENSYDENTKSSTVSSSISYSSSPRSATSVSVELQELEDELELLELEENLNKVVNTSLSKRGGGMSCFRSGRKASPVSEVSFVGVDSLAQPDSLISASQSQSYNTRNPDLADYETLARIYHKVNQLTSYIQHNGSNRTALNTYISIKKEFIPIAKQIAAERRDSAIASVVNRSVASTHIQNRTLQLVASITKALKDVGGSLGFTRE